MLDEDRLISGWPIASSDSGTKPAFRIARCFFEIVRNRFR